MNLTEHNSNTGFLEAELTSSSGCVYGMACCRGFGHHFVPRLHNGGNFGRVALQLGAIFKHYIHNMSRPTPQRPATSSLLKPMNSTRDKSPDVMEKNWSELHIGKGYLSLLQLLYIYIYIYIYIVGTESIQTPLHFSLFVILQLFAKII